MARLFDRLRDHYETQQSFSLRRAAFELIDGFLHSPGHVTRGAPHVRDSASVQRLLNNFVIATIPCWIIGMWSLGRQTHIAMQMLGAEHAEGWRGRMLEALGFGYDPFSVADCLLHGFLYFLPIFVVALLVGTFWEALFAQQRKRRADDGLFSTAWLYTLILPATASPLEVALGMTVAVVVGKAIFGGSGRYLVSPPILGVSFLIFSYSDLVFGPGSWVPIPAFDDPTTLELIIDEGGVATLQSVGYSWFALFIGNQPGSLGVTSTLGCLLGAIYLVGTGSASWRIMAGSFIGMVVVTLIFNAFADGNPIAATPWTWHMVTGAWAFGTVFLATDPVAAANTNPGRWAYGVVVGALTIIVRVTNPGYYEGVIFAILLASVFAPVFDYIVVERNIKRRRRRLEQTS